MKYFLSIHHIHKTHEDQLVDIARKYIKTWLDIQTHGVTSASIFHPYMLGVKAPSQLYKEAHAGNLTTIRSKGDEIVNGMIDSRIEKESAWTRKSSTTTQMQTLWNDKCDKQNIVLPQEDDTCKETYTKLSNP